MLVEICVFLIVYCAVKVLLWYQNRVKIHRSFALHNIPGPTPSVFDGNLYQLRKGAKLPHEVIGDWLEKYGDVFGYYMGEKPHLIVNDLDMLQQIFITKTAIFRNRPNIIVDAKPIIDSLVILRDERWKKARRIISPTFSNAKVTSPAISDVIELCGNNMVGAMSKKSTSKDNSKAIEVDIYPIMQATSLDVIARTALNMPTDVHNDENVVLHAVREYFSEAQNIAIEIATLVPFLRPVMTFVNNHMTAGKMTDMTVKHIQDQLLEIVKAPIDPKSQNFLHSMINSFSSGNLSKEELIANAHIILLAGYETTANSVTYALWLLARHPEIQDRLREYFINGDSQDLDYFEMVWYESLRILPPVVLFLVREASEDVTVNGVFIAKGTTVQVPVWQIHHREDVWPDPYSFDPERFAPENRKLHHPMAFLTFGCGPRVCLGMQLANHEGRLLLRRILTSFRVEPTPLTPDPLTFKCSTVFINPENPVHLRFVPLN